MPERIDGTIVYYRSKSEASGATAVGCMLLAFATLVLTQEGVAGIRFSTDLVAMSTYLALPLGAVLVLANIRHLIYNGRTMIADKVGITLIFTPQAAGPVHWTEIDGFITFWRQGRQRLGITLIEPVQSLDTLGNAVYPLINRRRPKAAHLMIEGKMLNDNVEAAARDLDEMRQIYSWRA